MWSQVLLLQTLILAQICHAFVLASSQVNSNDGINIGSITLINTLFLIKNDHLFLGSKYIYGYESHVQSKVGSFTNDHQSKSRHLSPKIDAQLAITYLWQHQQAKNDTIFSIQVRFLQLMTAVARASERSRDS